MTRTVEERIEALEERTAALEERLAGRRPTSPVLNPSWRPSSDHSWRPDDRAALNPSWRPDDRPDWLERLVGLGPDRSAEPRRSIDLEDALGGRVLAWVGGLAVALGVIFLLAIAVSRGWIGEVERTVMAGAASLVLLAAGAWWYERKARIDAAKAATAAGIVGLFATCVVAAEVYALVPAIVALVAALLVGAAATVLAVRWEAQGIAALGILGALLSPALVGALPSAGGVVLLLIANASAVGVLLWQRWNWLAAGAFLIATPQWISFVAVEDPSTPLTLAILVAFGALNAVAAAGFEVRESAPRLRAASAVLLTLNALVLAATGTQVLAETAADGWLVFLAALHLGGGLIARRTPRFSSELSLVVLTLGVVLANVAAVALLDGLPLVLGWSASAVGFAALARLARGTDQNVALAGLGGHLVLALAHALVIETPPDAIAGGPQELASLVALAAIASSCVISGRLLADGHPARRIALDTLGLAVLGYQTAVALDGLPLTLALAAEAVALLLVARRAGDRVALGGATAFAGAALLHALALHAPPEALVTGLDQPLEAAIALIALAAVAALFSVLGPQNIRLAAGAAAAVLLLYTASVELVTPFQPGPDAVGLALTEIDVRQQGQALLSALWALTGVAALVAGLVRDRPVLRHGALLLLGLTVGKAFLFDLAALTSLYRVASFIALGLLLLAGAFAWQRIRPRPLPDLRAVPGGLR
jgi:uncharacterized membrane protein